MVKKILDRYFLEKIADEMIRRISMKMCIDIYYIRDKNNIIFYCNYIKESKRLLQDRMIGKIDNTDIIYTLMNLTECIKGLEDRINEILR